MSGEETRENPKPSSTATAFASVWQTLQKSMPVEELNPASVDAHNTIAKALGMDVTEPRPR